MRVLGIFLVGDPLRPLGNENRLTQPLSRGSQTPPTQAEAEQRLLRVEARWLQSGVLEGREETHPPASSGASAFFLNPPLPPHCNPHLALLEGPCFPHSPLRVFSPSPSPSGPGGGVGSSLFPALNLLSPAILLTVTPGDKNHEPGVLPNILKDVSPRLSVASGS